MDIHRHPKNLNVLKEGLTNGKYYINDELSNELREEFKQFLNEDPIILGADVLTEGKNFK